MSPINRPYITISVMIVTAVLFGSGLIGGRLASAQDQMIFFQIATGGVDGTYYPLGTTIANAISRPPGSRPCDEVEECGVKNLVAAAQSSTGSVENVQAVESGIVNSAFAQADIVYAAYSGIGPFADQSPKTKLRGLAHLYPEVLHILARKDAKIDSVLDLVGKKVSIDEPGSGLLVLVRDIFKAYGIDENEMIAFYLKPGPALDMLVRDELDALFQISGMPSQLVANAAENHDLKLVSLTGPMVDKLLKRHQFLNRSTIPADIYRGAGAVETLSVGSEWIVSEEVPEQLVYDICRALWSENTRKILDEGHPQGRNLNLDSALDGITIPLHKGAERCYRDLGVLP